MMIAESELYVFITDFLNYIFAIIIFVLPFIYAGVLSIYMYVCVCIYILDQYVKYKVVRLLEC